MVRRSVLNAKENMSAEELIEKYSDMIYRVAFSRTQNVSDAQDITQDVFLKYLKYTKAGNTFRDEEHRKAWLLKVAVNTGNTFVTTAWFRHRASLDEVGEIAAENKEDKSEVYEAVMDIPEKYRVVIHLFYYEELSIKEICNILNMSETAVKSRLHRARELLREKLKGAQYEF
ncbi:MAG: sigma-70 family RNA polymerase sigma factor [Lachnospiraceae bacterium]|nr:sigma-70 family RNA polymerase sigma factor [Lachnospiraceae bacterium]